MGVLVFDTETTGFARSDVEIDHPSQPDIVQLAAILYDGEGVEQTSYCTVIRPGLSLINPDATRVHGITQERAIEYGCDPQVALSMFLVMALKADTLVAHNMKFDAKILRINMMRYLKLDLRDKFRDKKVSCTMTTMTPICRLPFKNGRGGYRWPKLGECYEFLFGEKLVGAHDALVDAKACGKVFFEVKRRKAERSKILPATVGEGHAA